MANKPPPKVPPPKSIETRRNVAPYIIMAIMAGLSVGISATYIFMSQTTPLREELRDLKKKCLDLSKENEELKKRKEPQSSNENIVKENNTLRNELVKKNMEYDKLKNQLAQVAAENKTLSSKMNNISQEYNRLKKNEEESIQETMREFKKLGMLKESPPKERPEEKDVFVNSTTGFFNNSLFITLRYLHGRDKITATIHSSGYQEMKIDDEVTGKTFTYNSNKTYEIRIMRINPNYNNGAATFLVSIK